MNHKFSKETKEYEFKLKYYEVLASERLKTHKNAISLVEDILECYPHMDSFTEKAINHLRDNAQEFSLLNHSAVRLWWQLVERIHQFRIVILNYSNDKRSAEYHREQYLYHGFHYLRNRLYRDMLEGYDLSSFVEQIDEALNNAPFADEYDSLTALGDDFSSYDLPEPIPLKYPENNDSAGEHQVWEASRLNPVHPKDLKNHDEKFSRYPMNTPFNTHPLTSNPE